jgi:hypothetical protein
VCNTRPDYACILSKLIESLLLACHSPERKAAAVWRGAARSSTDPAPMAATMSAQPLQSLPPDAALQRVLSVIAADGAVVIRGLASRSLCERVRAELQPFVAHTSVGLDSFSGGHTLRTGAIVARSPSSAALWAHPTVMRVADTVLGQQRMGHTNLRRWNGGAPSTTGGMKWQLSMTQLMKIGPGESRQFFHHDKSHYTYALPPETEPELATMWALSDFTASNGATFVVPGSHLWDEARVSAAFGTDLLESSPEAVTQAVMPMGSCLLYTSSVLHAGGDNSSTAVRGRFIRLCAPV